MHSLLTFEGEKYQSLPQIVRLRLLPCAHSSSNSPQHSAQMKPWHRAQLGGTWIPRAHLMGHFPLTRCWDGLKWTLSTMMLSQLNTATFIFGSLSGLSPTSQSCTTPPLPTKKMGVFPFIKMSPWSMLSLLCVS